MKKILLLAAMSLLSVFLSAQNNLSINLERAVNPAGSNLYSGHDSDPEDDPNNPVNKLDSVVISSFRAEKTTPVAFVNINREQMRSSSPMSSLPLMLGFQPSVVATNEGGTGLGYSKMRVRGSDGSRINVTLNGVTLNDAESQEVFWVNIPALTGMLQSVQLQRGVGTSVNGPGAFGASVNMQTLLPADKPYGEVELSGGSYLTGSVTVGAGSGRMSNGLSFDVRYSYNTTEGYIRNAFARLHSLYASAGWLSPSGNNSLKVNYILGKQRSGITWEGIPSSMLSEDRRYNPAGEYHDAAGNVQYYDNETDNYLQHHLQGIYTHQFTPSLFWMTTLNFTKGDGYYENFKENKKFSDYGLPVQTVGGVDYKRSNVIVRQAMDNSYYVASTNLKYNTSTLSAIANVSYSLYDGDHFGNMIWAEHNASIADNYCWYTNNGLRRDLSTFLRGEYSFLDGAVSLYADMQYRHIAFDLTGEDKDFASLDKQKRYNFFNPKGGLSVALGQHGQLYASLAIGHKEPTRSDLKEAIKAGKGDDILPERLMDYEAGYSYNGTAFSVAANLYFMEYKNQLLETGKLSESGYTIKENVPLSYRRGVEVSASWLTTSWLRFDGNITLSVNKIRQYTAWVDRYDNPSDWGWMPQVAEYYENTSILMSPSVTGTGRVTFTPAFVPRLSISVAGKYVGKQYYDNTSCEDRSLPAYTVMSAQAEYSLGKIKFAIFVDNMLNRKYVADAWVYRARFADGSADYVEDGMFPQAGINGILKVSYTF